MAISVGPPNLDSVWICVPAPLQITQSCFYFLSVLIGLITAILVGVVMENFQYVCVLSAEVVWDPPTVYHGSESLCSYVLFVNVAVFCIYALLVAFFTLFILGARVAKRNQIGYYRGMTLDTVIVGLNNIFTVFNGVACLMALASAAVVTSGFSKLCGSILRKWPSLNTCQEAQNIDWTGVQVTGGDTYPVADNFWNLIFGIVLLSWISVGIWLTLFMLYSISCCKFNCSETCWDPEKTLRHKAELRANSAGVYRSNVNIPMRPVPAHAQHRPPHPQRPPLQGMYAHPPPQGMYAQARAAPPPVYSMEMKQPLTVEKRPIDDRR